MIGYDQLNEISSEQAHPPLLYDAAPPFRARTTMGERSLAAYRGKWVLFFSHPADFTPVCTSEFLAFAAASAQFAEIKCELLALSVDSLFSHLAWVRSIRDQFGVEIGFPIIEDPSMMIAKAYGMISPRAPDSALVRAAFIIDPQGIIRAIVWYPMTTGRNIDELLRLIKALQTCDTYDVSTPAGWQPGDDVILPSPLSTEDLDRLNGPQHDWYYRLGRPSKFVTAVKSKADGI